MLDPNEFTAVTLLRNALRAMSVSGGYHYDLNALSVKLDPNQSVDDLIAPDGPRPFIVLEVQPDEFMYAMARSGLVEIKLPVTIHWVSDSVPTDDESLLRTFYQGCADVEKAVAAAITLGGNVGAFDIRITQRRNSRAIDSALVWAIIETQIHLQRLYGES